MSQDTVAKAVTPSATATAPKKAERPSVENEPQPPPNPLPETPENSSEIKIDPEFRDLHAPLSEAEYALLEKDICEHGCTTPLIVDQHVNLVDGHNREKICTQHDISFEVRTLHFESRDAIKKWILENQLARRNLTDFQRAETALQLKPLIAGQAKANQKAAGGAVPAKSTKPVDTREEVAKMAGTSSNTMTKVEYILENADEETKNKLRRGERGTSINKVYKEIKALEKTDDTDEQESGDKTSNTDSEDAKRVDALLARVCKSYENFSKDAQDRLKEGLYKFLCDIDYPKSEDDESNEEPEGDNTDEESEDDPDDDDESLYDTSDMLGENKEFNTED